MASIIPVVLSGGVGTRLWPLSTTMVPKQFMRIWEGGTSLFEQTLMRVAGPAFAAPVVIANVAQEAVIRDSAARARVALGGMVLEPTPRDSAAAIAAAAAWIVATYGEDATLAVLPADHLIPDAAAFRETLRRAAAVAAEGYIVTVGIAPDRPATEFGYIERGLALNSHAGAYAVARFKEKPAREVAERYLAEGRYLWNAGIFVWRADVFLAELRRQLPELHAAVERIADAWGSPRQDEVLGSVWSGITPDNVDQGVLEGAARAGLVATVPADIGWNDVGDWDTLADLLPSEHGVARLGGGAVLARDCANTLVCSTSGRLVAGLGLRGLLVIDTPDAVLVAPRDRAQEVKAVVDALRDEGRDDLI